MDVRFMSPTDRLAEMLRRSKPNFGPDVQQAIDRMLSTTNLAILGGTLTLWAGSHLFGLGEVIDVLLLAMGAFSIGWSVKDVGTDLYTVADTALDARTDADLTRGAQAFAHAVVLAGITVIMAVLLRRSVRQVQAARGTSVMEVMRPRNPGLPNVGADPEAGRLWSRPGISNDPTLQAGEGSTSPWGEVRLSPAGSASDQALARAHELVHRLLTPRLGVLRQFRVQLGMAGYLRSALLQYLEEALAETYAQLRQNGLSAVPKGLRFPVANGYMTVTDLVSEGAAVGTISVGSSFFSVQFIPSVHESETAANACYMEAVCR